MGLSWMILVPKTKTYVLLPKKGEWAGELWKIWEVLQDIESGETLKIINDESKLYNEIIEDNKWNEYDHTEDSDMRLYYAENIVSGGHSAFFDALRFKEMCEKKKNEAV